jgi:Uma2 family endonuclease
MVEDTYLPIALSVPRLTDAEFRDWCDQYPDYNLEYTADGELIIMPPTDPESGARTLTLGWLLRSWVASVGRGIANGSDAGFLLPNGARRSPDAAWMTRDRLHDRPGCPQFVVELVSPFDKRKKVHEKMLEWIENGAELAWMIDPDRRTVSIYRPGREVEVRKDVFEVEGEGPVVGFVLDLREIWDV